MYARLLDAVPGDHPFPSVKWAGYAAFNASLDDIAETAEKRGLRLCGLYGMSEVQALYSLQPIDSEVALRKKGGGACRPRRSVMSECAIRRRANCWESASRACSNAPALP